VSVRGGGYSDDGLVEGEVAGGAVEVGVTEGEDVAVGGDQPVAATVKPNQLVTPDHAGNIGARPCTTVTRRPPTAQRKVRATCCC
jgi:hypothetical protein